MNASLEGRVAFISGAGHGIGRATARAMAKLGATVGINDLKHNSGSRIIPGAASRGAAPSSVFVD